MTSAKTLPTISEYFDMLSKHDFLHTFSDDYAVFAHYHAQEFDLRTIALASEPHMKLFKQFTDYFYSGDAFGTKRAPAPERHTQE